MEQDKNKEQLIKKKMFSGLLWKFGERISAQLISLIISIVLARLLAPDDYGIVTLVMIYITIANVFVSSGLGNALIQKKDADNLDFSSVFYINIILSCILYILLFLFSPYIAMFYDMPILSRALRILGIRIPIAAINSIQQAYISRNMLFKRFFWATLIGTLLSGFIGIGMAYHGFGVWALIAQYLTNTCTDTFVLWFTVHWRPELRCSLARAKHLISFGWKLLVSGLLDTGYNQLRSLIIGKVYSPADLAYYSQGEKYPSLITTNVNSSISSVLFPVISQFQDDLDKVKYMTRRSIQISSYVMWPLMIGLAVIAKPLVRLILTEKWLPCVPYLRIFCISYGLWPIHTANLQALNAMGRSDLFLKLELCKKGIGIFSLLIAIKYGAFAIALSLLITSIISTFINSAPNWRLLRYTCKEQLCDLAPPFSIAVLMGVLIYPITYFAFSNYIIIILQIFFGSITYILLSVIFKPKAFIYLLQFCKLDKFKIIKRVIAGAGK